jgi:hypothetical protein
MVNVFTVVGECREDPWRLLVMDAEGDYYDYLPAQERFTRVMADRVWTVYRRPGDPGLAADTERDPIPLTLDGQLPDATGSRLI